MSYIGSLMPSVCSLCCRSLAAPLKLWPRVLTKMDDVRTVSSRILQIQTEVGRSERWARFLPVGRIPEPLHHEKKSFSRVVVHVSQMISLEIEEDRTAYWLDRW